VPSDRTRLARVSLLGDHKYSSEKPPYTQKGIEHKIYRTTGNQGLNHDLAEITRSLLLTFGTNPKSIPHCPRYNYPVRTLVLSSVGFTHTQTKPRPVRDPSTLGDRRRYLAFLYSEYFCAANRTDTLSGRSAILEHNPPRVAYLPLSPALHAISCRHRTLLLFLLLLYCYYKSKALSIPSGLLQQRFQDFGKPHRNRRVFDFLLLGHMCRFS